MFTKSKDTSLTGLLELSVIKLFLCFQELNYSKIDLISHLKRRQIGQISHLKRLATILKMGSNLPEKNTESEF